MCKAAAPYGFRLVARFAFAGVTAALLAGCADTSRFTGDPLGNPFKTASTDPAPTGSLERSPAAPGDMAPPYQPRTAVVAQPLAAPSEPPHRFASYEPPVHTSPRASQTYVASSGHGSWSASGGMPIVAATGESAEVLAARYDVPTDALLRANGFRSAAEIRPGTRLVIPVYNAGGARAAESEPIRAVRQPQDHAGRERLDRDVADRKAAKHEAERQAAADRETQHHKAARHDAEGETMHWVRGPKPARLGEPDPRSERKAQIEDKRALRKAEADERGASRKTAKADTAHGRRTEAAQADDGEQRSSRMAKVEPQDSPRPGREIEAAPPRKAQSDPTPTASLPPADEKVAGGGPEFRWPAHGRIIQGFRSGGNDGINIAVPEGTSVKAAESGVVAYAGSEIKGFGNLVLIRHPNGFVSAYANNADLEVHRGEQVKRGQVIAKSGQSGNVASPQLHFELRKGSTPVDPTRYLAGL